MSLPEGCAVRRASADDISALVAHRRAMFVDMGYRDETALDAMAAKCHAWLLSRMNRGEYLAWLAVAPDQSIVAGTGLWLMDWPPHMIGSGTRGNILNVYTAVEFRRRGLAGELMKAAMGRLASVLWTSLGFHCTARVPHRLMRLASPC